MAEILATMSKARREISSKDVVKQQISCRTVDVAMSGLTYYWWKDHRTGVNFKVPTPIYQGQNWGVFVELMLHFDFYLLSQRVVAPLYERNQFSYAKVPTWISTFERAIGNFVQYVLTFEVCHVDIR